MATKAGSAIVLSLLSIWIFVLINRVTPQYASARLGSTRNLDTRSTLPICHGFEGDPAFYGLGIRVGIYLQWFSAWLSNAMNPMGAAFNHDANSIFLFALLIALTVARSHTDIHPVELYIMLLLSNGFVFTVLSVFGVRLYLLQPTSMSAFLQGLKRLWDKLQTSWRRRKDNATGNPLKWLAAPVNASIGTASNIKHPSLSWAGVAWRTAVIVFLAALNISFWFSAASTSDCTHLVFFFGDQQLKGSIVTFFKVASIIMAVPYTWFLYICIRLTFSLVGSAIGMNQQRNDDIAESILPKNATETQKRIFGKMMDFSTSAMSMTWEGKFLLTLGRLLLHGTTPHPFRNIAEAYTMLLSRGIESDLAEHSRVGGIEHSKGVRVMPYQILGYYLCMLVHLTIGAVTACFVAFIEYTIRRSNITGVYTLGTTDQLIPFTIGLASTLAAFRECGMLYMRMMYPDWHQSSLSLRLETSLGGTGIALDFMAPPREAAVLVKGLKGKSTQQHARNRARASSAPESLRSQSV